MSTVAVNFALEPEKQLLEIEVTILRTLVDDRNYHEILWGMLITSYFKTEGIVLFEHRKGLFCFVTLVEKQQSIEKARSEAARIKRLLDGIYKVTCKVRQKHRFTVVT